MPRLRAIVILLACLAPPLHAHEKTTYSKQLATKAQFDAQSMQDLADSYWFGNGVKKNPKRATELYIKASKLGHVIASIKLYQIYKTGTVEGADLVQAKEMLDKAYIDNQKLVKKGSEIAILRNVALSDLPYHTYSNIKDNIRDLESIDLSKAKYVGEIQYALAKEYLKISKFNRENKYAKALERLNEAVKLNNPKAMLLLADAYENGDYGLLSNKKKADVLRESAKNAKYDSTIDKVIYDGFYNFPLKVK